MRGRGDSESRQMDSRRCGEAPGDVTLIGEALQRRLAGGPKARRRLDERVRSVWFEREMGGRRGVRGCLKSVERAREGLGAVGVVAARDSERGRAVERRRVRAEKSGGG